MNPLKYGQKKDCTGIQLAKVGISYGLLCGPEKQSAMLILLALRVLLYAVISCLNKRPHKHK